MMKTSFSLSSLRGSTPATQSTSTQRPYNSLTKKRKQYDHEAWLRCWGGSLPRDDNKDEFWAALQPNYNYIMDNNLIESCTEANGELRDLVGEMCSFRDLASQFSELYSWLNNIQESVYVKDEGNTKIPYARLLEEMDRQAPRRITFIEQATRLVHVYPEIKDEVTWRIAHLNSKWDAVIQAMSLADPQESQMDIEKEVRCLRKWMNDMKSRLAPLSFRRKWTLQELEDKSLEHKVLQKDIESHGKIVTSILKYCSDTKTAANKTAFEVAEKPSSSRANLRRSVEGLERRWHLLLLRSLEWQCLIENLHKRLLNTCANDSNVSYDSDLDEEPVPKQPRLNSHRGSSSSSPGCQSFTHYTSASSDNEISTSSESDGEFYFEDGIENTCVLVTSLNHIAQDKTFANEMEVACNDSPKKHEERKKRSRIPKQTPPDVCARTTKIDYNGPNNVTYYCQHRDTDSGDAHTMDQSSDEEWVFESTKQNTKETVQSIIQPATNDNMTQRKLLQPRQLQYSPRPQANNSKLTKDELHRLVQQAEKLVSTPAKVRKPIIEQVKYRRVKEWLNRSTSDIVGMKNHVKDDACDASGEYTTGESDPEKESESSEDLNGSVATFRQIGGSSTEIVTEVDSPCDKQTNVTEFTPKVHLRNKRNAKANRPWSVACISSLQGATRKHFTDRTLNQQTSTLHNFSISESALHELATLSVRTNTNNLAQSVNNMGTIMNSSESTNPTASKVHRKKLRARKYTLSSSCGNGYIINKSESGSEVNTSRNSLHKSGSFCSANGVQNVERNTCSDPHSGMQTTGSSSVDDSEDEINNKTITENLNESPAQKPDFKLGAQVSTPLQQLVSSTVLDRDSSPEKHNSLNTNGTEEHSSSLSDWDNYLEKYMSEPYSETPDSEAARRLLEFGEDYRNYIDSQSDCCSSLSACTQSQSPAFARRYSQQTSSPNGIPLPMDSESDVEEYRHVIRESRAQLYYTEEVFAKQIAALEEKTDALQGDFVEISATCRENLHYLQVLLKVQGNLLSNSELRDVKSLLGSWSSMLTISSDLTRARSLDKQVSDMRTELIALAGRTNSKNVKSRAEVIKLIDQLKAEETILQDRKRVLLHLNVAVHRFLSDCTRSPGSSPVGSMSSNDAIQAQNKTINAASAHLKDRVADLYRLWTETYNGVSEQLNNLQGLHNLWSQLEIRLEELQGALRSDENTLRLLDSALQDGAVSADVAVSVRDVAKVLSEKNNQAKIETGIQSMTPTPLGTVINGESKPLNSPNGHHVDVSGSLSDSGISDEGSEQELSERERRLAMLRRLIRQLESALEPGSEALTIMSQRIEQTENELRDLQRTCRALIVRTAVCAEVRCQKQDASTTTHSPSSTLSKRKHCSKSSKVSYSVRSGDPEDDPGRPPWLWRVMRASLPFQLAIVAIFCVACLLEPHCCDRINNLSMSLSPQLRYIKGPPPV